MGTVNGHLLSVDGTLTSDVTHDAVAGSLAAGTLLWLDLCDSSAESIALLHDVFCFHPLAVEDAQEFGQRPKAEDYDGFTYVVAYGAPGAADAAPREVHSF